MLPGKEIITISLREICEAERLYDAFIPMDYSIGIGAVNGRKTKCVQ
jgi:hypothetical protein